MLLLDNFARHIYHVGSSHDTHSIIQSGLIPGGKDVKKGRHAEFFAAVIPMYIDHHREKDHDVTKPRIAVYIHNWKILQNIVYWCNLSVAQSKGLLFSETRSNAIIFYNTLPATCVEGGGQEVEELYSKTYQSPIAPQRAGARKSFDHSDKHGGTYRETCRGEIDFRTQGLPQCISSRITRTKKQYKNIYNESARSIRSASSRRKSSTAWERWSTPRFARSLPTYNAPTV